jgi:hypothetical protein
LGPPVEVGAPPGAGNVAGTPDDAGSPPAAAPSKPRKPKKKPRPPPQITPEGVVRQPMDGPPADQPRRERLEPVQPNILPRNLF